MSYTLTGQVLIVAGAGAYYYARKDIDARRKDQQYRGARPTEQLTCEYGRIVLRTGAEDIRERQDRRVSATVRERRGTYTDRNNGDYSRSSERGDEVGADRSGHGEQSSKQHTAAMIPMSGDLDFTVTPHHGSSCHARVMYNMKRKDGRYS